MQPKNIPQPNYSLQGNCNDPVNEPTNAGEVIKQSESKENLPSNDNFVMKSIKTLFFTKKNPVPPKDQELDMYSIVTGATYNSIKDCYKDRNRQLPPETIKKRNQ